MKSNPFGDMADLNQKAVIRLQSSNLEALMYVFFDLTTAPTAASSLAVSA